MEFKVNYSYGRKGMLGDKGDIGIQGDKGIKGIIGLDGNIGIKGCKGETGLYGLKGEQGYEGLQGINVYKNLIYKGEKGIIGNNADKIISIINNNNENVIKYNNSSYILKHDIIKGDNGNKGEIGEDIISYNIENGIIGDNGEKGLLGAKIINIIKYENNNNFFIKQIMSDNMKLFSIKKRNIKCKYNKVLRIGYELSYNKTIIYST